MNAAAEEQLRDNRRDSRGPPQLGDSLGIMRLNAPAFAHAVIPNVGRI